MKFEIDSWFLRKLCFKILMELQYKLHWLKGPRSTLTSATYRHVKINGSPVSLTENSAVFRNTDFKKKSRILKNPLIVLPFFFLLKAISCDNLAEVAEKNQFCILARPDDTC